MGGPLRRRLASVRGTAWGPHRFARGGLAGIHQRGARRGLVPADPRGEMADLNFAPLSDGLRSWAFERRLTQRGLRSALSSTSPRACNPTSTFHSLPRQSSSLSHVLKRAPWPEKDFQHSKMSKIYADFSDGKRQRSSNCADHPVRFDCRLRRLITYSLFLFRSLIQIEIPYGKLDLKVVAMNLQMCDAVALARILNATLVLPDLKYDLFWKDDT